MVSNRQNVWSADAVGCHPSGQMILGASNLQQVSKNCTATVGSDKANLRRMISNLVWNPHLMKPAEINSFLLWGLLLRISPLEILVQRNVSGRGVHVFCSIQETNREKELKHNLICVPWLDFTFMLLGVFFVRKWLGVENGKSKVLFASSGEWNLFKTTVSCCKIKLNV